MRLARSLFAIVLAVSISAGCADTPRQTIELSNTVGRDLVELHRAHRELVGRYFGRMKADVNTFVDTKYRPYIINFTLTDPDLAFMSRFQNAIRPGANPDAVSFMSIYSRTIIARIDAYRGELMAPLVSQESQVLSNIDDSYQRVIQANAVLSAHIASVVKVNDAQNEILASMKLQDLRKDFVDRVVQVSDGIGKLVDKGQDIDVRVKGADAEFDKIKTQIQDLVSRVRPN